MNPKALAGALALLAVGFATGAWWMDARRAVALAGPLAENGVSSEPARWSAPTAGAMPSNAATPVVGAASPLDRPAAAAPSPTNASIDKLMPQPPASWMTVEQQRTAAEAYREWVRDLGRQAGERIQSLNAELFLVEGEDPAWGASIESKVRASMAGSPVFDGVTLESIECRVTVCRATLHFVEADNPRGVLRNGGQSPWSTWRNAQIIPTRSEMNDGVPGFRATVYLGEDFDQARLPRGPRAAGPGGP